MKQHYDIDFVLPWVDGQNAQWLENYQKYAGINDGDSREIRFRNWDLLRYWFRSVETFAPWVHKVHFITSGELPEWLNTDHPQLNWVKHEDYIPEAYLPTFSANTIELNIHRIKGLSDRFVYFNDDLFLISPVEKERFFSKGLPCDLAVMTAKPVSGGIIHMVINDLDILDRQFRKKECVKKNLSKWFSPVYGKGLLNNILLSPWKEFPGFIDPHLANSFLKPTFAEVWETETEALHQTCMRKFRSNNDVNQWLMRYWQLAKGCFAPYNTQKNALNIDITDNNISRIYEAVSEQKHQMICLNDSTDIYDFEHSKKQLQKAFEKILPNKSAFEK
ncbi:glycosyl transferase [Dysgonomonas sp. 216]|uniref:stealth conserved region 3 domain-containing protein n=1 Tax=Dysgonomonas sp. 216 TaxID=2302934 RepID=UPI0013D0B7DF|nr:stealth conserved region 3 domain-containing protein [Dysgonomonas sp. 216]NDW18416.1 glycosyl transferase [Dysgonomonas sp. 216]